MKSVFTKLQKLPPRQSTKVTAFSGGMAVLMLVVLVRAVIPATAHAWTIYPSMWYTPVMPGGYTTISWSAPTSDWCEIYYTPGSAAHISGESCYTSKSGPVCSVVINGTSGSVSAGPIYGSNTYSLYCYNASGGIGSSWAQGWGSVTVSPSCPASSFGSPWNGNSYLIYSGGQGSISNWYGRYCLTNYSSSAIFIPMATPTEWNDFTSRASAIGIGITAY